MIEYLVGPNLESSVVRNITGWEIIEKHVLLDVMRHGHNILNLPLDSFTITNKIIDHYGILLNSYPMENISKFRFDKTLEYLNILD